MKEEYCQSCGEILRFPESAKKVICNNCDAEWIVLRTGSTVNLAPMGTMQTVVPEATLQQKLKDLQRQALIKEGHSRELQHEIESIVIEFVPIPLAAKAGAAVAALFFLAGAGGAWFFTRNIAIAGALVALAVVPFVGLVVYGRQINQRERQKLVHKKELITQLAVLKKEIGELNAQKRTTARESVIEE